MKNIVITCSNNENNKPLVTMEDEESGFVFLQVLSIKMKPDHFCSDIEFESYDIISADIEGLQIRGIDSSPKGNIFSYIIHGRMAKLKIIKNDTAISPNMSENDNENSTDWFRGKMNT